MDETDFSIFKSKKSKHDKADATATCKAKNEIILEPTVITDPEKRVIISRSAEDDTYNCNNPNVGIALIFNHKNIKGQKPRNGTEEDREALRMALELYGFDIRAYNDLTFAEVNEELKKTASEDHSKNDCLLVAVMSHGAEGKVYAKDMAYPVERLWYPFLGESCRTLINKPKLFFIQACRGENFDKPVVYTEFATMSRGLNKMTMDKKPPTITYAIPSTADMLVFYSTFEKYFSFRNVENGSWFIQCLCEELIDSFQNGISTSKEGAELLRLLTAVNRKVAYEFQSYGKTEEVNQKKEMPNFLSTLTKTFYLRAKPKNFTE